MQHLSNNENPESKQPEQPVTYESIFEEISTLVYGMFVNITTFQNGIVELLHLNPDREINRIYYGDYFEQFDNPNLDLLSELINTVEQTLNELENYNKRNLFLELELEEPYKEDSFRSHIIIIVHFLNFVAYDIGVKLPQLALLNELKEWKEAYPEGEEEDITEDILENLEDGNIQILLQFQKKLEAFSRDLMEMNGIEWDDL